MADDNPIDSSVDNNEVSKAPVAGFNVHPENINRRGRPPKGHSITETIRAMMDEKPEIKKMLAAKILQLAAEGDITAMKTIWNYLDGMPMQKSDLRVTQLPTPLLGEHDVQENDSAEQVKETE